MRLRARLTVLVTGAFVTLVSALAFTTPARAQVIVDFVISSGTPLATGPGDGVLTFAGGVVGGTQLGGCGPAGTFPLQAAISAVAGVPVSVTVVLISTTAPLKPGTQVRNLSFLGHCQISNSVYSYYRGMVQ